ncbi:MAG: hypothetical protein GXN91_02925 [Epsilonproteobacteria bacterium]|nr:hypothetical protein [Campylobacterota bacterium]
MDSLEAYLKYLSSLDKREQKYLKLLSTIVALFDGKITKEEYQALIKVYQDEKKYYLELLSQMKKLLKKGHIHQLTKLVLEEMKS